MASFIKDVESVAKIGLKIVPFIPIPGVPGVLASGVAAVLGAELSGKPGPDKKAQAMATTVAGLTASGIQTEGKLQVISELLEGLVQVFNALATLFGEAPLPQTTPGT